MLWRTKQHTAAATAVVCFLSAGPASYATPITDTFGQEIDSSLDEQVSLARTLRSTGKEKDIDTAIKILSEITEKNQQYYRAWFNLGLAIYQKDEKNSEAFLPVFAKAVAIENEMSNISDPSIYNTIGYIYLDAGQFDKSREYLEKGLKYYDGSVECDYTYAALLYNLGRLYFEQGSYDESVKLLSMGDKECNNPKARELLAVIEGLQKKQ